MKNKSLKNLFIDEIDRISLNSGIATFLKLSTEKLNRDGMKNDFENAKHKLITDIRRNELSSLLKKAGYGKYQEILKAMAEYSGSNVPLDFISEQIELQQNEYSTNINNLIKREIITRVDKGIYCFVNPLLKEYIRNFGIIDFSPKENEESQGTNEFEE